MIVRCGRCQAELEVPGAGEFVCPACGSRNVVRSPAASGPAAYDLGNLSVPGQRPAAPSPDPQSGVRWEQCPRCDHRFAMGEVERVTCPNCRAELSASESGIQPVGG
jgi:DNA-directed RNA polymerase subunit RPC12/RpoP